MITSKSQGLIIRAGAHSQNRDRLRMEQQFRIPVTNLAAARVMYSLETGVRLYLTQNGRWFAPDSDPMNRIGFHLTDVVQEMIRTGLLRHWRDRNGHHLVAAKVHLLGPDKVSACHFVGEDLGAMRSRLVTEPTLVDCLDCVPAAVRGL